MSADETESGVTTLLLCVGQNYDRYERALARGQTNAAAGWYARLLDCATLLLAEVNELNPDAARVGTPELEKDG